MSERYKLIIAGTRSFNDYEMLRDAVFMALLEQARWTYGFSAEIVSGGAPGADPLANFRTGALLRAGNDSYTEMYEEAKNYRRKQHVVHIERNGIAADKGDESLDDTIVYSAIMAYMRHCHEQELSND